MTGERKGTIHKSNRKFYLIMSMRKFTLSNVRETDVLMKSCQQLNRYQIFTSRFCSRQRTLHLSTKIAGDADNPIAAYCL